MEMTSVYIVYATDDWGARKGIVGVYSEESLAIEDIIKHLQERGLSEDDIEEARYELLEYHQTQGITKADNFEIAVNSLNEWDW